MQAPIVLAYSGGLDTSWCIPWLKQNLSAPVVTVTVDAGGISEKEREELAERSRILGAVQHIHVDARQAFFEEVLRFLIFGNVLKGNLYPICVGAERSLQAREVARVAHELGAKSVAHGCTAAGNDQVRFEVALRTVAPELTILAPVRDEAPSRQDEVAFLAEQGFVVPPSTGSYSVNSGLWGVTIGGKETLHSKGCIPESAWLRTRNAFDPGAAPSKHTIAFDQGTPSALDGVTGNPVEVIEAVDALAASYGLGRGIHLGETILGIKGRVAFEAPAASVLIQSHRELEKLVLTGRQCSLKETLGQTYGELIHSGQFFEPTCRDIEALLGSSQRRVTGEVYLLFRPGSSFVEGVESPHSLLEASGAKYGESVGHWSPQDAKGFSRLVGLPGELHARAAQGVTL